MFPDVVMPSVFSVITDFLASEPTPQQIIAYRFPTHLEVRSHELLERNGEGLLNFDEQQEMYDFIRAEEMMSLLQAKMRVRLKRG